MIFLLAAASILSMILGIWVYKNNPKSATNQIFGVLGFVVSIWVITMYLAEASRTSEEALMLIRLTILFAAPMNALFFLLAYNLPSNDLRMKNGWLASLVLITVFMMALSLTPLVFSGIEITGNIPTPVPGPGLALFGLISILENIGAVAVLAIRLRKSEGLIREQLRFVMLGIMLMFGAIISAIFIPVLVYGNASLVSLAPAFTLFFLVMAAYAIIHHGLLDVKLIVARAVSFVFASFLLAAGYGLIVFSLLTLTETLLTGRSLYAVNLLVLVGALLSFKYVEKQAMIFSNKIFFKRAYDPDLLMDQLTRIMAGTIDLDMLTQRIIGKLTSDMNITKAVFVVFDQHKISGIKGVGYTEDQIKRADLDILFHSKLGSRGLTFEEIEESPMKRLFRELDVSFAFPIAVDGKDIAILLLGRKLSGEVYFDHDVSFLNLFAREAGIAIQNSKTYSEIKLLNKELEHRVEARTKDLKESQERELDKAKSVAKLKDEFVFVAAHELRAPITAIRGFLELASEDNKKMPKSLADNLEQVHYASDHLNRLVNDLLEVARSEADAMEIEMVPVDISALAGEVIKELTPIAKKNKVKLESGIEGSCMVMADNSKMKEVMVNLVSNSIKYNKAGGLVFIQAVSVPGTDEIFIEVRDTGYGIPAESQDKIFGKFFRAPGEHKGDILGTGLGLFITRMLIQKMGGDISFSSVPGEGTTFSFYLKRTQ